MAILVKHVKASTVRGYTLETRRISRGFWIFKEWRTVAVLVEHRRNTYLVEQAFKPTEAGKIITVNESVGIHTFEDSDAIAALHTLAHYNAQIADNIAYTNYQHD